MRCVVLCGEYVCQNQFELVVRFCGALTVAADGSGLALPIYYAGAAGVAAVAAAGAVVGVAERSSVLVATVAVSLRVVL